MFGQFPSRTVGPADTYFRVALLVCARQHRARDWPHLPTTNAPRRTPGFQGARRRAPHERRPLACTPLHRRAAAARRARPPRPTPPAAQRRAATCRARGHARGVGAQRARARRGAPPSLPRPHQSLQSTFQYGFAPRGTPSTPHTRVQNASRVHCHPGVFRIIEWGAWRAARCAWGRAVAPLFTATKKGSEAPRAPRCLRCQSAASRAPPAPPSHTHTHTHTPPRVSPRDARLPLLLLLLRAPGALQAPRRATPRPLARCDGRITPAAHPRPPPFMTTFPRRSRPSVPARPLRRRWRGARLHICRQHVRCATAPVPARPPLPCAHLWPSSRRRHPYMYPTTAPPPARPRGQLSGRRAPHARALLEECRHLSQVGEIEGVRWKGYPCKELHAAAFRVAKTP